MDTGSNYGGGNRIHPLKTVGKVITGIAKAIKGKTNLNYKKERDAQNLDNAQKNRDLQYAKMGHQNDLAQMKHVDDIMKNNTKQDQLNFQKYKADQDYDIKNKHEKTDRYKTQASYNASVNNNRSSDYHAELNQGYSGAKGEGGKGKKPKYNDGGQMSFDYSDFDEKPEMEHAEPKKETPTPDPDMSDIESDNNTPSDNGGGDDKKAPPPPPEKEAEKDKEPEQQPEAQPENPTKDVPQPEPKIEQHSGSVDKPKGQSVLSKLVSYMKDPSKIKSSLKKIGDKAKSSLTINGRMSKAMNAHDTSAPVYDEEDLKAKQNLDNDLRQQEYDKENLGWTPELEKKFQENTQKLHQELLDKKNNTPQDIKIGGIDKSYNLDEPKTKPADIDINQPQPDETPGHKPADVDISYDDRHTPDTVEVNSKDFPKDVKLQPQSNPEAMDIVDKDQPMDMDISYDDRSTPADINIGGKGMTADGKTIPKMMKIGYKEPKETNPKDIKLKPDIPNPNENIHERKSDEPKKSLQTPKQQSDTKEAKKFVANQILEPGTQKEEHKKTVFHRFQKPVEEKKK